MAKVIFKDAPEVDDASVQGLIRQKRIRRGDGTSAVMNVVNIDLPGADLALDRVFRLNIDKARRENLRMTKLSRRAAAAE